MSEEKSKLLARLGLSVLSAWIMTGNLFGTWLHLDSPTYGGTVSWLVFAAVLIGMAGLFFWILTCVKKQGAGLLFWCCYGTGVLWAVASGDVWFTIGLALLFFLALRQWEPAGLLRWEPREKTVRRTYAGCFFLLAAWLALVTVSRYLNFRAPCFDMGIFSQMFESMRRTGAPVTTCERNFALSHFQVHTSPIFYVLLPLYALAPSPITLQVGQALVTASGLIPLYLLCRRHRLESTTTLLLAVAYALYPALSGSCFYDLHENCFLAPCLLWVVYGMTAKKTWVLALSAVATLAIKEDAGIYLAFLGLYFWLGEKRRKTGLLLFFAAVAAFGAATWYLSKFGDGILSSRFDNLLYEPGGSMLQIIKTVLVHPAYALRECFTVEKLQYLLLMLLPFGGLLVCKTPPARYLLLGPMLLLNVMPDYEYLHTIHFQYNFGTTVLLFYFAILQLAGLDQRRQRAQALSAVLLSGLLFAGTKAGSGWYLEDYLRNRKTYQQMEADLDRIPTDASVTASTYLVAHLYEHEELYQTDSGIRSQYLAIDLRWEDSSAEKLKMTGYELIYQSDALAIYRRN